jgi:hypothetical protein
MFDQSKEAIEIFDKGIKEILSQLCELNWRKAEAQASLEEYSAALETLEPYRHENEEIQQLYDDIKARLLDSSSPSTDESKETSD